jgi:DNA invertase Pin-like site-specific DNA recombinase
MIVGYARVSSVGQSLDVQEDLLTKGNCQKIFSEKRSGRSTAGRDALAEAIEFVRDGDVLAVTRLDRLARSVVDLHRIVQRLADKGCGLRVLQQAGVDTTTSTGKLTLSILAAVAEFEADIRKERQREGIDRAQAEGVYKGRRSSISAAAVRDLHDAGRGPSEIARQLGIGRASVYRYLGDRAGPA